MMNKERRRSNHERTFLQLFDGPTGGENRLEKLVMTPSIIFEADMFSIDGGDEDYGLDFYGNISWSKNSLVKPNSYAGIDLNSLEQYDPSKKEKEQIFDYS